LHVYIQHANASAVYAQSATRLELYASR